ncbi:MAG: class I SAM-dependent methyltransferase [Bacteroidota bacterium]
MSNENSTIHEFDFSLICEYFSGLERQGPGSPEMTLKALSFIPGLQADAQIADLGCGTGGQTMVLARHTPVRITGIDLFPGFIDRFNAQSSELGFQERVKGICGSMDQLPFGEGELDLIWSEGAIYNIGFERGLKEWHRFLKTGGYIAVSEACWFTGQRPGEIEKFWLEAYPGIDTIPNKLGILQMAGYIPVATFILPEDCWTEHFYRPQEDLQDAFLNKHAGNTMAASFIASERHEEKLYRQYKEFYGYAFFIGRKF